MATLKLLMKYKKDLYLSQNIIWGIVKGKHFCMDATYITEKMLASVKEVVDENRPNTQKFFESEAIIFKGRVECSTP